MTFYVRNYELTGYLWQELELIQSRASAIQDEIYVTKGERTATAEELKALTDYKVRVENILLETDVKESSQLLYNLC